MTPFPNPFTLEHVPLLWTALLIEFGCTVEYWLDRDPGQSYEVPVIWKEGAENEDMWPGRYSVPWIANDVLPRPPRGGDAVMRDGLIFDVVRVDAISYGYSRLVLHEDLNG